MPSSAALTALVVALPDAALRAWLPALGRYTDRVLLRLSCGYPAPTAPALQ